VNYISCTILFFNFTPSLELLCTFVFSLSFLFSLSCALLHPYSLARLPFSHCHPFKLSPALSQSLSFSRFFTLSHTFVLCRSLFFALSHSYLVLSSHTVSNSRTLLFPFCFFFFLLALCLALSLSIFTSFSDFFFLSLPPSFFLSFTLSLPSLFSDFSCFLTSSYTCKII